MAIGGCESLVWRTLLHFLSTPKNSYQEVVLLLSATLVRKQLPSSCKKWKEQQKLQKPMTYIPRRWIVSEREERVRETCNMPCMMCDSDIALPAAAAQLVCVH